MDIHRCRFVPYQPPSISALAFSHASDLSQKTSKDLRLALGRENGDIEIWNPSATRWVQETVLRGSTGSTVEQLAWTQDLVVEEEHSQKLVKPGRLRLFSIGGSDYVSEWSLSSGVRVRSADSNFGNIWCFAAQPSYPDSAFDQTTDSIPSQLLVAGTVTGNIVLFSTNDGELHFQRLLQAATSKKSKALSITWRDRNTVVAGYENGLIRVFDVPSRSNIRQMTLGKTPEGGITVVWSVKCLSDGTIVSGDSSGELKIWDAQNFSLVQRLKSHHADILDITASGKGDQIFTFGVDRRTVAYQVVPTQPGQKKRRWAQVMHRRFHDHDVKCAASYESKGFSVLVSGGMDASPTILPMKNWQSEFHRSLPHLPQKSQMSTSRNRLLCAWWAAELHIYHIPQRRPDGELSLGINDFDLLATLKLKDDDHIQSAQISQDGAYIVTSTSKGVRLFQLRKTQTDGETNVRSRLVPLPAALQNYGAHHVGLSPNNRWLFAVRFDGTLIVSKILPSTDPKSLPSIYPTLARLTPESDEDDNRSLGSYADQIAAVSVSADSRVLSTGSLSGRVTTWTLEGHEDLSAVPTTSTEDGCSSDSSDSSDSDNEDDSPMIHAQQWTRAPLFPRLEASILALCIRQSLPASDHGKRPQSVHSTPQSNIALHATRRNPHPLAHEHPAANTTIIVLTSNHTLTEFSITTGKLTPWSRRNPSSLLPTRFRTIKDRALGVFLHHSRLWLYGSNWLYMLDLSQDFTSAETDHNGLQIAHDGAETKHGKKRKRLHPALQKGTGAGDLILNRRVRDSGVAPTGVKYKGEEGVLEVVQLEQRMKPVSDRDDDDGGANDHHELGRQNRPTTEEMLKLRRDRTGGGGSDAATQTSVKPSTPRKQGETTARTSKSRATDSKQHEEEDQRQQKEEATEDEEGGTTTAEYCTFRYRAIFGIGILNDGSETDDGTTADDTRVLSNGVDIDADGDTNMLEHGQKAMPEAISERRKSNHKIGDGRGGLEVVIVERPMYDVPQSARFDGGQDWDF